MATLLPDPGDYRLLYDQQLGVLVQFTRTDQIDLGDVTAVVDELNGVRQAGGSETSQS